MPPDEAKKQLWQAKAARAYYRSRTGTIDDTRPIAEGITDAQVDEILAMCHDLIAEVESLKQADIRNHEIMACYAEEKAELEVKLDELVTGNLAAQHRASIRIRELEAKVCAMREVLQEVADDDDPWTGCSHAARAKQALSLSKRCLTS